MRRTPRRSAQRRVEAGQRRVATEQLQRLEQWRRDAAGRDRDPHRTERVARLEPELLDELGPQRLLDRRGGPGVRGGKRLTRRGRDLPAVLVEDLGHVV